MTIVKVAVLFTKLIMFLFLVGLHVWMAASIWKGWDIWTLMFGSIYWHCSVSMSVF